MFDNVGEKIKKFAVVYFVLGVIVFVIIGTELIHDFVTLLSWFVALFIFLISSWVLYGFGEIIVKVAEIAANSYKEDNLKDATLENTEDTNDIPITSVELKCHHCNQNLYIDGNIIQDGNIFECPYCGKKIKYT